MSDLEAMIQLARESMDRAYAPYSRFHVGACLRSADGRLFAGCNVENASFPEGWCAETSAIAAMILAGARDIVEVVVVATSEEACSPCGGCRQRLSEFAAPETQVHMCSQSGSRRTVTLGELLPDSFTGDQLLVPRTPEAVPDF